MTTRLEYLLGMANDRSDWLLTSNPSLNYILVKDSGSLMYPEPPYSPLNRFFSTSGLTDECDECFKKAAQDLETKLKLANNMSDTLNDLTLSDIWDSMLSALHDLGVIIGDNYSVFFVIWEAIQEAAASAALSAEELAALKAAFDNFTKGVKDANLQDDINYWRKEAGRLNELVNQPHYGGKWDPSLGRPNNYQTWEQWSKNVYESEKAYNAAKLEQAQKELRALLARQAESKSGKLLRVLSETLFNLLKKSGIDFLNLIGKIVSKCFKFALKLIFFVGLGVVAAQLYDLMNKYAKQINDRCLKNQNDQKDLIAQRYAAADQYYRDLGKCYQAGCCDDPNPCKGIGGWCTRIRDGADFSFYIPCCSVCDCDGDTSCKYAYCSSCDPDSKCPGKEDDLDTNDTQSNTLPSYLFPQNPSTLQQGCPPVPPGWQRHPNGTDPDPRSSPEWKIPTIYPCPSDVTDELSYVWKWWEEFFGGGGGGGGSGGGTTTTTAD